MGNKSNFSNERLTIYQSCDFTLFAWELKGGSTSMWYEVASFHPNYYGGTVVSLIKTIQGFTSWMWSKSKVSHLQEMLVCLAFGCKFKPTVKLFKIPYKLKTLEQPSAPVRQITVFTTKITSYKANNTTLIWPGMHCIFRTLIMTDESKRK